MNDLPDIIKSHRHWLERAKRLEQVFVMLCVIAATSSVLISIFTQEMGIFGTRCVAVIAALSIGYLVYFNPQKRIADIRRGWRHLNNALDLYSLGQMDINGLAHEYAHAKQLVGHVQGEMRATEVGLSPKNAQGNQLSDPLNLPTRRPASPASIADDKIKSGLSRIDIMQLESQLIYH